MNISEQIKQGFRELALSFGFHEKHEFAAADNRCCDLLSYEPVSRLFSRAEASRWQETIALNARKYTLAAQCFGRALTSRALCCATAYTLAGCVLDSMIDDGTLCEREQAMDLLLRESGDCRPHLRAHRICYADELLLEVHAFFESVKAKDESAYMLLKAEYQRAAYAEASASVPGCDAAFVRDKSELFVLHGFRIAACGRLSREEERLYKLIGKAVRLVDDLCDLEDDQEHCRANSILCSSSESPEQAFQALREILRMLQRELPDPFYRFLLYDISLWTRNLTAD